MKTALKAGTPKWIPLKDLAPHPLAQRRLDPRRVAAIAASFDPALIGTITVAETKKGKLWIVDGQTRHAAAIQWLNGDVSQCVYCNVIPVEDDAEAAVLFLGLNDHKSVKTIDTFLVRIVAKDPIALGIVAVLGRFGLRVDYTRGNGHVQAVAACEWVLARDRGAALLERTIRILNNTWGNEADAYHMQLIKGVALLLIKHGAVIAEDDLVRKLAKRSGPLTWIGRGREHAAVAGISVPHAVAELIQRDYNKGRRSGRLEDRAA